MSRVTQILVKARRILSDRDSIRWSDDDLIDLLNEGLGNFILHTKTLKLRKYMLIENYVGMYDVSPYASSVIRVQYLSKVLEAKTAAEMDKIDSTWEDTLGDEPKYVIFNPYENSKFRLYPKVATTSANVITQNSFFGGLIDIGVTDDLISIPEPELISQDLSNYVLVFIVGLPRVLSLASEDTEVDLHKLYDQAMVAYISGQCLLYDQDSISLELAKTQLSIYESFIAKTKVKESGSNNTFTDYTTDYRNF